MPDLLLEKRHLATGRGAVIGIDEAGRGPLFGDVYTSAASAISAQLDRLHSASPLSSFTQASMTNGTSNVLAAAVSQGLV